MNRIKVVICGKEYFLKTEEDASYIYNLAKALDKKINSIMNSANVSSQSASVMLSLTLLDDLKRVDKELNNAKQTIADMQETISSVDYIKQERDNALKEVKRLNTKIKELENSIKLKDLEKVIPETPSKSKSDKK
ncbi:MAG: cell division protein ZapA [Oscillospiraceae bacterium]